MPGGKGRGVGRGVGVWEGVCVYGGAEYKCCINGNDRLLKDKMLLRARNPSCSEDLQGEESSMPEIRRLLHESCR